MGETKHFAKCAAQKVYLIYSLCQALKPVTVSKGWASNGPSPLLAQGRGREFIPAADACRECMANLTAKVCHAPTRRWCIGETHLTTLIIDVLREQRSVGAWQASQPYHAPATHQQADAMEVRPPRL